MRPLLRHVPQLHRLAVFDAVVRSGTFTAAGQELGISQPAVSKHMSELEAQLRLVLFDRSKGRPRLTEEGAQLHTAVNRSFTGLERSLTELRFGLNVLTIAAQPAVASNWLSPRMNELREAVAPTEPHLVVFQRDRDLEPIAHDVSIRFGDGNVAQHRSVKLLDEVAVPAASPAYARQMGLDKQSDPRALVDCNLLEFDHTGQNWANWTKYFAPTGVNWEPGPDHVVFPAHASALSQAILGKGVILTWRAVRQELFEQELLVEVGPTLTIESMGLHLVWPPALGRDGGLRRLKEWLIATAPRHYSIAT